MFKDMGKHLLMGCILTGIITSTQAATDEATQAGRVLNPYHEQQLQEQIRKCASGVLACSDMEMRCVKQQELCQLLIRSERFDQALQVANNIFKTDEANGERKAAHHFLMAEIYNRKMKASRTVDDMEKNRQFALSVAQEVVDKKYPAQWGVSEHARGLIRDLNDSRTMGAVKQRVASREDQRGDSAKEAIADAQRKYLDQTQGRGDSSPGNSPSRSQYSRVSRDVPDKVEVAYEGASAPIENMKLSDRPEASRVFTPINPGASQNGGIGDRLQGSGLLTSQPGTAPVVGQRQPLMVNGQVANNVSTSEEIAKNNLAQLLEAARKRKESERKSPYAVGEGPAITR